MKLVRTSLAVVIATFMSLILAWPASAAWTPTLKWEDISWTNCAWGGKIGAAYPPTSLPTIFVGGGNSLDKDSIASDNGASQSYYELTRQAVQTWDYQLRQASGGWAMEMRYEQYRTDPDVTVGQVPFLEGQSPDGKTGKYLGYTYIQRNVDSNIGKFPCLANQYRPSPIWNIVKASVLIDKRGNWFTQYGQDKWNRSVRKEWELCGKVGQNPEYNKYTCTKEYDYGSVITHELGHVLGLIHPTEVSSDPAQNSHKASKGQCNNIEEQATMCALQYKYRTAKRTLHVWDIDAYHYSRTLY